MFKEALIAWLLMSSVAMAATNSTIFCQDSNVLEENVTVYMGTNATTLQTFTRCPTGCDNTTFSCKPTQQDQSLMFLAYFVGFIVVVVFMMKILRVF